MERLLLMINMLKRTLGSRYTKSKDGKSFRVNCNSTENQEDMLTDRKDSDTIYILTEREFNKLKELESQNKELKLKLDNFDDKIKTIEDSYEKRIKDYSSSIDKQEKRIEKLGKEKDHLKNEFTGILIQIANLGFFDIIRKKHQNIINESSIIRESQNKILIEDENQ